MIWRLFVFCGLWMGVGFASEKEAKIEGSLIRVRSTKQAWSVSEPWKKENPVLRRALAAVVGDKQVVTTAEMVADAEMIEFESLDGTRYLPAMVVAVDYEANLALLQAQRKEQAVGFSALEQSVAISDPQPMGSGVQVLQAGENGMVIHTEGVLQSVAMQSSLVADAEFLTYGVKASMQSAAGSYSLPVVNDKGLVGVLLSYHSKDQLCQVVSTEVLQRFLKEAKDGDYRGFGYFGVEAHDVVGETFRKWLHIEDGQGGVYIGKVLKGGSGESLGLRAGDVLMEVDGNRLDRRGYYLHPLYGRVLWTNLVTGDHLVGESIRMKVWRDGKECEMEGKLKAKDREHELIPTYHYGKGLSYCNKGGMVFMELSLPVLQQYGREWMSEAPLGLLKIWQDPERYRDRERVVYLAQVMPTSVTVGYEGLEFGVVTQVNGKKIGKMSDLRAAFEGVKTGLHRIDFLDSTVSIYMDAAECKEVEQELEGEGMGLYRGD